MHLWLVPQFVLRGGGLQHLLGELQVAPIETNKLIRQGGGPVRRLDPAYQTRTVSGGGVVVSASALRHAGSGASGADALQGLLDR